MKPILKSAKPKGQPSAKSRKFARSELFFEVKPYTQTVIFTDKNTAQEQQTPPSKVFPSSAMHPVPF